MCMVIPLQLSKWSKCLNSNDYTTYLMYRGQNQKKKKKIGVFFLPMVLFHWYMALVDDASSSDASVCYAYVYNIYS